MTDLLRPFMAWRWWLLSLAGVFVGILLGRQADSGDPELLAVQTILWVVLVYPFLEELVFRGGLQGWLLTWLRYAIGPITLANVLTSLAFALTHVMVWGHTAAALVFVPSLAFGWTRDAHGSVAGAVVMHALWNAAFLLGRALT